MAKMKNSENTKSWEDKEKTDPSCVSPGNENEAANLVSFL
jgi:hypothetical protein